MSMAPIIRVDGLGKKFRRYSCDYGLKDVLLHSFRHLSRRAGARSTTVLEEVSFELCPGDSLALLGANGAGKSTLLGLLAGIIEPTTGSIAVDGRIGLMLELGSGFCHDLSGRENIRLNGLLLGESRRNLERLEPEIIEFSGLAEVIDEPLRTYSTGMQTRLGFAIACHVSPDIMLIDEVLAVGDSEFQRKCLEKLREMQRNRVVLILVTHSLEAAEQFCDRAIYLDNGRIRLSGPVREVTDAIRSAAWSY